VGHLRRLARALREQVALRTRDLESANIELLHAKERAELAAQGVILEDTKEGVRWKRH